MDSFSLKAYVETKGESGHIKSITPQKFKIGDHVRKVNPHTMKPYGGKPYTVLAIKWYADTWFYLIASGLWTNEEFLSRFFGVIECPKKSLN